MAIDLRETVSAMKISSDLERIGDLSKNIAKRSRSANIELPDDIKKILKLQPILSKKLKISFRFLCGSRQRKSNESLE